MALLVDFKYLCYTNYISSTFSDNYCIEKKMMMKFKKNYFEKCLSKGECNE